MTAPRRVPTEVERAAAAVEAGHAWRHTANSRPGFATWPHTQPGDPSWWRHDVPAAEALRMFDPQTMSGTRYGEQMRAAFTAAELDDLEQHRVNESALGSRPAPECLTSHPQMHADCDGCTCSCHPPVSFADEFAPYLTEQLRDPEVKAAYERELRKETAAPRRRWWHRLTRRNP